MNDVAFSPAIWRFLILGLLSSALACDADSSATSTWSPKDHAQPAAPEQDRVPAKPSNSAPKGPAPIAKYDGAVGYKQLCASCHGSEGQGGSAPALKGQVSAAEVLASLQASPAGMPDFTYLPAAAKQALADHLTKPNDTMSETAQSEPSP